MNLNKHLLGQRPPLDSEDNAIFTSHADGGAASSYGFHCIFHLEEMPVRTEYCDGTIIRHVDCCYLLLPGVLLRLYSNDIYCYLLMSIAVLVKAKETNRRSWIISTTRVKKREGKKRPEKAAYPVKVS